MGSLKNAAVNSVFLAALLLSANAEADPFQPKPGWACSGTNAQNSDVSVVVRYVSSSGGQDRYRVQLVLLSGESVSNSATVENVLEEQSAQAYSYSGSSGGTSVQLIIRKVEGSDQGLRSTLKSSMLTGVVNLECNRTR